MDFENQGNTLSVYLNAGAYGQAKYHWEGSTSPYECGEDSFFMLKKRDKTLVIGIADGVGGWNAFGVSSAFMARQMMQNAYLASRDNVEKCLDQNPSVIMTSAYNKIKLNKEVEAGSTTCCILSLDIETSTIYSANIGDSGYIIIRNKQIIVGYRSNKSNGILRQLAIIPERFVGLRFIDTNPSFAEKREHQVQEGDVIVLASDGFWDNIPDLNHNLSILINELITEKKESCTTIAKILVDMALGYDIKVDDITVVVAQVILENNC